MYPFIAEVTWFDESDGTFKTDNLLMYEQNMSNLMRKLEAQYKDIIDKVIIHAVGDEYDMFQIPSHMVAVFVEGNGDYEEGTRRITKENSLTKTQEEE